MHGNCNAATVMLGLPGFVLLAVLDLAARLSTRSRRVRKCPACGVLARLDDRRFSDVRDLPATGRAVTLVWISGSGGAWSPTGSRPRCGVNDHGPGSWLVMLGDGSDSCWVGDDIVVGLGSDRGGWVEQLAA